MGKALLVATGIVLTMIFILYSIDSVTQEDIKYKKQILKNNGTIFCSSTFGKWEKVYIGQGWKITKRGLIHNEKTFYSLLTECNVIDKEK